MSLNTEHLIHSENVRKLSIKDSLLNEKGRIVPNRKLHNHPNIVPAFSISSK